MSESHYVLRWDGCLVESQEGLEIKVGLRAGVIGAPRSIAWFYVNGECGGYGIRAITGFLNGIDYEMPELGSDDLIMDSELCLWSPTVALHVLLNSGVEGALMCLDSLRLPSCVRTLHIGSNRLRTQSGTVRNIIRSFLETYAMSIATKAKNTKSSLRLISLFCMPRGSDDELTTSDPEI
ncbi:hypothetical protein M9H77_18171 [Catharanthus roseus]|uniref:Uncharacterized protein n=1 Tax=Catharanthus roseus TaxID=4058 RepID=A0ACC0B712_CATRO|nr:hypothetical protein M9H77_18171 [Catharanthus roseus]